MQGYINRIRVNSEIRNTKVQYPGGIASNNQLYAAGNCNKNFSVLNYTRPCCGVGYTRKYLQ